MCLALVGELFTAQSGFSMEDKSAFSQSPNNINTGNVIQSALQLFESKIAELQDISQENESDNTYISKLLDEIQERRYDVLASISQIKESMLQNKNDLSKFLQRINIYDRNVNKAYCSNWLEGTNDTVIKALSEFVQQSDRMKPEYDNVLGLLKQNLTQYNEYMSKYNNLLSKAEELKAKYNSLLNPQYNNSETTKVNCDDLL